MLEFVIGYLITCFIASFTFDFEGEIKTLALFIGEA